MNYNIKMNTLHEKQLHALKLIKEHKSNDFINFFNDNIEDMDKIELYRLYQESCSKGNVVIVDFLLNCSLNNKINYDFPYVEHSFNVEEIPNGAIFLAFDNSHLDLIEYFIKNDIYHIDSKTEDGLDKYMGNALEELKKIDFKIYLSESLDKQEKNSTY